MTPREQFLVDLLVWASIVYAVLSLCAGAARAVVRIVEQRRRLSAVLADPMRYCAAGHVHVTCDDAMWCEASLGYGEL